MLNNGMRENAYSILIKYLSVSWYTTRSPENRKKKTIQTNSNAFDELENEASSSSSGAINEK